MDVQHHCVPLPASWYKYMYSLLDLKKETDLWLAGSISNLPNWHGITSIRESQLMHTYL